MDRELVSTIRWTDGCMIRLVEVGWRHIKAICSRIMDEWINRWMNIKQTGRDGWIDKYMDFCFLLNS